MFIKLNIENPSAILKWWLSCGHKSGTILLRHAIIIMKYLHGPRVPAIRHYTIIHNIGIEHTSYIHRSHNQHNYDSTVYNVLIWIFSCRCTFVIFIKKIIFIIFYQRDCLILFVSQNNYHYYLQTEHHERDKIFLNILKFKLFSFNQKF